MYTRIKQAIFLFLQHVKQMPIYSLHTVSGILDLWFRDAWFEEVMYRIRPYVYVLILP